MHFSQSDHEE